MFALLRPLVVYSPRKVFLLLIAFLLSLVERLAFAGRSSFSILSLIPTMIVGISKQAIRSK